RPRPRPRDLLSADSTDHAGVHPLRRRARHAAVGVRGAQKSYHSHPHTPPVRQAETTFAVGAHNKFFFFSWSYGIQRALLHPASTLIRNDLPHRGNPLGRVIEARALPQLLAAG